MKQSNNKERCDRPEQTTEDSTEEWVEAALDRLSEPYYSVAMENNATKFRDVLGINWAEFLDEQLDGGISKVEREIFWMMGATQNRSKPIGLYFDRPELVEKTDAGFFQPSKQKKSDWCIEERKRRSLLESIEYFGLWHENTDENYHPPQTSRAALIQPATEFLRASQLTLPEFPTADGFEQLEEYVEDRLKKINTSRDADGNFRNS